MGGSRDADTMDSCLEQLLKLHRIEQFLYREARFIDQRQFSHWEALWDDAGIYWVPANGEATDPESEVSLIYDNRSRLHTRIERYSNDSAHSQNPPSRTTRVISNVELEEQPDHLAIYSTFHLAESRPGARIDWAGHTLHHLIERDTELLIRFKKVVLVDNDRELTTLDFLL